MAGLLSDSEKASLDLALDQLAQTFERDIFVYSEPTKTIIRTSINYTKYNDNNQNNTNIENTPVYTTIKARILYEGEMSNEFLVINKSSGTAIPLKTRSSNGRVRIKVNEAGFQSIKEAKKIEFDGEKFDVETLQRPHGLFNAQYYTYWLKRVT